MGEIIQNYKDMKLGDHGLPQFDALYYVVLKLLADNGPMRAGELKNLAADSIGLPDELRYLEYGEESNNNRLIIIDRLGWAMSNLFVAEAVTKPAYAIYEITDLGRQLLLEYGSNLDLKIIHSQDAFIAHKQELNQTDDMTGSVDVFDTDSPEDMIDTFQTYVTKFNQDTAADLLKNILVLNPTFFENLVVKLLVAMGYSDRGGNAWVTKQSGDGGIDGIINRDPLGTSTVYIQAKRYSVDVKVRRPEIQAFNGALMEHGADRGVFITTSDFTKEALDSTKALNIIAINGARLTELMMEYRVGVKSRKTFEVFEVDDDFFE